MRKTLGRMPSPAMGVAFVALLAALTGTAVALPGSNTVTSGDITNSAVKTQDIKNSTVRGRDVRNNTLTGSDINEGSLGTVPAATRAGSANSASFAGGASIAGVAASVSGIRNVRVNANDDSEVPVLSQGGYSIVLTADSVNGCALVLRNVSAGNDGNADSDDDSSDDFDQGEEIDIDTESVGEGTEIIDGFYAHGASTSIQGGGITREAEFAGTPDCVANVNAFTP